MTLVVQALSGGSCSLVGTVSSDVDDLHPSNNVASAAAAVEPATDLRVAISSPSMTAIRGLLQTYDVAISNSGPSDATGVVASITLPEGVEFVSASPDLGDDGPTIAGNVVSATIGSLASGGTTVWTVVVRPTDPTADSIEVSATVSGSELDEDDSNNAALLDLQLQDGSDLSVTLTTDTSTAGVGDTVVYTVTVSNTGPADDPGVSVVGVLPAGLSFALATSSQGEMPLPRDGGWSASLGPLASGASATISLTVVPTAGDPDGLASSVTVAGPNADPDDSNDTAGALLAIEPVNLAVSLDSDQSAVRVGSSVRLTATVRNLGDTRRPRSSLPFRCRVRRRSAAFSWVVERPGSTREP